MKMPFWWQSSQQNRQRFYKNTTGEGGCLRSEFQTIITESSTGLRCFRLSKRGLNLCMLNTLSSDVVNNQSPQKESDIINCPTSSKRTYGTNALWVNTWLTQPLKHNSLNYNSGLRLPIPHRAINSDELNCSPNPDQQTLHVGHGIIHWRRRSQGHKLKGLPAGQIAKIH